MPDSHSEFGHYRPSPFLHQMLTFAQNAPQNWLGQQFAQLVRKLYVRMATLPTDISVGSVRMRCYLKDNNSEYKLAFMPWRFDQTERECLARAVSTGGVLVDIGANVGIYTLHMATHVPSSARIIALEPNPPAYERLRFNVEATKAVTKDWPQIDLLPFAVADSDTILDLHLDPNNLGSSSVATQSRGAGVVRVTCKPLLHILSELGIQKIDALKIDIEGAEDMALMPYLQDALDEQLPKFIVIANSEHLWKQDLVGALKKRGYKTQIRNRMNTVYVR
jgi:FkbM family methyltransferase